MASYPPQIIQQPLQQPFNVLQNPIINAYASAMMRKSFNDMESKDKATKQQAMLDKFSAFAKSNGKDLKYSYGPGGLSASTIEQKDPTLADLQVGKNMGIKPEILPPERTPGAAMSLATGGAGDVEGNPVAPVQADYGQTVMNALRTNPMVNRPGRQATQLPSNFANDFKTAHDMAAGDSDKFVTNLKDLALQYSDNPAALTQIKRLVDLNKPKKQKAGVSRLR